MKKIICLILALLMVFSMAACQSGGETPTPTENAAAAETPTTEAATQATELPTEAVGPIMPTEPAEPVGAAELSLAENSTTVTFDTSIEYDNALNKMGYIEVNGQHCTDRLQGAIPWQPTKLVYNDTYFRLDFEYSVWAPEEYHKMDMSIGEIYNSSYDIGTGWSLYGKRKAVGVENISRYQEENFVESNYFDREFPEAGFCLQRNFNLIPQEAFDELERLYAAGNHGASVGLFTYVQTYFFPGTGNLYNLAYTYRNEDDCINEPDIFYGNNEELNSKEKLGSDEFYHVLRNIDYKEDTRYARFTMRCPAGHKGGHHEVSYIYEVGQTLEQACDSGYIFDWESVTGEAAITDAAFGPCCVVVDADKDIRDLIDETQTIVAKPIGNVSINNLHSLCLDFENPTQGVFEWWPDGAIYTQYETGMTFLDWLQKYGHSHDWNIMGTIALYNPVNWDATKDGMYFIADVNKPFDEYVTFDSDNIAHITLTTSLPSGFAFVPAS